VPIPRSSADYYRRQQSILARLLIAVRLAWRRIDPAGRWDEQYANDGIGAQLLMLVAAAQVAAARDADTYIAAVLAELQLVDQPETGVVIPTAFAGVAGDGRPVESLLGLAIPRAGQRFNEYRTISEAAEPIDRPAWMSDALWDSLERDRKAKLADDVARNTDAAAREALAEAERWVEQVAASIVIDAARAAESAATVAHPEVGGWVRMLNPPSCSRCVILAGKVYRWNDGFERHPLCDCRHIPARESDAKDLTVNPDRYFRSLTVAEQDRIFTQAGAQAIRDGADINQVVNARRGMSTAQVGGREVFVSSDGTTRFGVAYRGRTGRNMTQRLMPESIYEITGGDRDEAIRLLRLAGFIR